MAVETVEQSRNTPTNRLADKLKLRKLYVQGQGSLESLAVLNNVPYATAKQWFQSEKWSRLKDEYDKRELAKLSGPDTKQEPEQSEKDSTLAESQQQLASINESLRECADAKETEMLMRAKLACLKAIHYERYGCDIPSSRQIKQGQSKRQPSVTDSPEQVAWPEQAKPLPDLSSYSAEQLQEALRLKQATVIVPVTPDLQPVTEPNQTDLLRRTENG